MNFGNKHENLCNLQTNSEENKKPRAFEVYLHNDHFTPMEFVVETLEHFFFMERRLAAKSMLDAHTSGKTLCGIFTKDVAETKVHQVIRHARKKQYPLICSAEAMR